MYSRIIEEEIKKYLDGQEYKTFFIWGPRRSGKTTLITQLSQKLNAPLFNLDLDTHQRQLAPEMATLEKIAKSTKVILIDEVQNYPESTLSLKILHDHFKVKIIATGSSELRQKAGQKFDSLAGRFAESYCLPLSIEEVRQNSQVSDYAESDFYHQLRHKMQIFGCYPEVYVPDVGENPRIDILSNLLETYVLKDIVNIYDLKSTKLAKDILTKVALQLGSEVSIREIANSLGSNASTVSNYLEIFIKNYVLIPLPAFKTNLRRAISEHRKIYFYDLGIRNALVRDFRETDLRPDNGGVWENFIVSEIEKLRRNHNLKMNLYFYREYDGGEIDLVVEDYHKNYQCFDVKSSIKKFGRKVFPLPHKLGAINPQNYAQIISSFKSIVS